MWEAFNRLPAGLQCRRVLARQTGVPFSIGSGGSAGPSIGDVAEGGDIFNSRPTLTLPHLPDHNPPLGSILFCTRLSNSSAALFIVFSANDPPRRRCLRSPLKMSGRRAPNPAAERAAQNQQTIKSLLKLEPNKICADCKRNKREYRLYQPAGRQAPCEKPEADCWVCRSAMGELESRRLCLHSLLGHSSRHGHAHQQGEVC